MSGLFTLSVVSHQDGPQVQTLINHLASAPAGFFDQIILTLNVPEQPPQWSNGCLHVIHNLKPRGFGANHNHAFSLCNSRYFCVLNPDIELINLQDINKCNIASGFRSTQSVKAVFDALVQVLEALDLPDVGVAYPVQCRSDGSRLDFDRPLVTPFALLARKLARIDNVVKKTTGHAKNVKPTVDWINGAFMAFKSDVFGAVGGFDERYFMYCEDIDICLRLQLAGYAMVEADVAVVHNAQRRTLRNVRHLIWHVSSLLRLWLSGTYWKYINRKIKNNN